MALAQQISFNLGATSVAAEFFATSGDVYRLTGDLLVADDMAETADGKDKSIFSSARRIARMVGHDVEDADMITWNRLAEAFKEKQIERLTEVTMVHLDRIANTSNGREISIIGAGVGRFLVKQIAEKMHAMQAPSAATAETSVASAAIYSGGHVDACVRPHAVFAALRCD